MTMGEYSHSLDTTWAEGKLKVRPGESIVFTGTVTGVSTTVKLTFYADGDGAYYYKKGEADAGAIRHDAQNIIVKHAEMALIDAGFEIDTKAASPDYEPTEGG